MSLLKIILLPLLLAIQTGGKKPSPKAFPGACPVYEVVDPFNMTRYLGVWYMYKRYKYSAKPLMCVRDKYTMAGPEVFRYRTIGYKKTKYLPKRVIIGGLIFSYKWDEGNRAASFYFFQDETRAPEEDAPYDYNVIYTDYITISFVWHCEDYEYNGSEWHIPYLAILTRSKNVNRALNRKINRRVRAMKLSLGLLEKSFDRDTCSKINKGQKRAKELIKEYGK